MDCASNRSDPNTRVGRARVARSSSPPTGFEPRFWSRARALREGPPVATDPAHSHGRAMARARSPRSMRRPAAARASALVLLLASACAPALAKVEQGTLKIDSVTTEQLIGKFGVAESGDVQLKLTTSRDGWERGRHELHVLFFHDDELPEVEKSIRAGSLCRDRNKIADIEHKVDLPHELATHHGHGWEYFVDPETGESLSLGQLGHGRERVEFAAQRDARAGRGPRESHPPPRDGVLHEAGAFVPFSRARSRCQSREGHALVRRRERLRLGVLRSAPAAHAIRARHV